MLVEKVGAETTALAERLATVRAEEGALPGVAAPVAFEVARVFEGAGAQLAPERALPRVDAGMDAHVAPAAAPVAALRTPQRAVGGGSVFLRVSALVVQRHPAPRVERTVPCGRKVVGTACWQPWH